MLLDHQRVIVLPIYVIILVILVQQIIIAVLYTSSMLITIAIVLYMGILDQQISNKIERKILLKEFNYQYINKLEKNACIHYNYSIKKVQTEKQKILKNLNDITQSTSEKQDEYASSNISSQQKKSGSFVHKSKSDIEVNLNVNKDNGDFGSRLKNKLLSSWKGFNAESFNFKEEDYKFLQQEFEQAKNKFNLEFKEQKSLINIIKEQFLYGKQVINRQLYRKYQTLQLNSGIYTLKGSLHIIKLQDNQEYGIILFKQQEQKIFDLYISRIEQVQAQITQVIKELSIITSNSSMPIPHSIDKSDIVIHQTRTHFGITDLNQDYGIANSNANQQTRNQIESPGTLVSHSNIDIIPSIPKRQTINHYFNFQSQSQFNQYYNNHSFSNINCLNDINPCISKTINTQMQGNSLYAKHIFHNKNSLNTKNQNQTQQGQPQTQDICQFCASSLQFQQLWILIKSRLQIQTILNDLKEYQLSCLELQHPQYKKYKIKWIPQEMKQREKNENDDQNKNTAAYQQFQKDVFQYQQLIFYSNFMNLSLFDIQVLDFVFNDISFQIMNKKNKGVYDSVTNRILDIYQQRTSMTNLKIILDFFTKMISFGEKTVIQQLEYIPYIDPKILSEQEKLQFRKIFGDQLIEENSERAVAQNIKTQTTGIFHQAQQGISNQTSPLITKTERVNSFYQEEDLETYKDMILSVIQQIYGLYKDYSSGITMQTHKFYSKEGAFNPQLAFRKRYLKEAIKACQQLEQNKQIQKNNTNQIGNYQQSQQFIGAKNFTTLNSNQKSPQGLTQKRNSIQIQTDKKQNEIQLPSISNIQHASSTIQPYYRINFPNPYNNNEQINTLETPLKNQKQQQDSQDIENLQNQNKQQQLLTGANKNLQLNQMSVQVSQTMSNSQDKNNNQNSIQPFIAQIQQQITGKNTFQLTSMNEINQQSLIQSCNQNQEIKNNSNINNQNMNQQIANDNSININAIGTSREAQQVDIQEIEEIVEKGKYRQLKLVRICIKIEQSIQNYEYTSKIQKETNCLSQIEEYISYLSPMPLFYTQEKKDSNINHIYSFYLQNYLYTNNPNHEGDIQEQGSLMNLDQKMVLSNKQDIVSLDGLPNDQHTINFPLATQKSKAKDDNNSIFPIKVAQIKVNLAQGSRNNINDDYSNNAINRPSNAMSFQQSHDNIEQASDRKFLQSQKNLQIRDQQYSFNYKNDGTITPFQEINQEYTLIEINNKDAENKTCSIFNINNPYNDMSNLGITDRQVEEPSAERRLFNNIEKFISKAEYNASQNILTNGDKQKQLQQKDNQDYKDINNEDYEINIIDNIREREKSSDNFVNLVRDSKSLIKYNQPQENQSQCSDFEYKKEVMDERDAKELTVILELSEQNYSNINHYMKQQSKQLSSYPAFSQNPQNSFLYQKSQFQSQLLPEDHKQTISCNVSKNIYGIESDKGDARSIIHPYYQGTISQNNFQQLNSNISKEQANLTSQYYDSKLNKDAQPNFLSQNYESKLFKSD